MATDGDRNMQQVLSADRRGFTLVELVIALLIFALGSLGVIKLQQLAITSEAFNSQMNNTLYILNSEAEHLRGLAITDPLLTVGSHDGGTVTRQGTSFALSWTVSNTALGGTANALKIDIRVSWYEKAVNYHTSMTIFKTG